MSNPNKKLFSGIFWSVIEILIKRVLDLGVKLVLARLLFPTDFGVVGMATVFTSLIQVLNDAGMGSALIQRKQENLQEAHYQTVFWTGVIWALFLYLIVSFIVGPIVANFYKEPLLTSIIPVLSISILSNSLNIVHKAQLMKDLQFKKLAFINNTASVLSGIVSVVLAYNGFGVWSLVFNSVATFFISVPMFYMATKWKPKFLWDKKAFKDIFGFGAFTTGTQVINNISSNIDYLIIGKILSASVLGAYTLAYMLTNMVKSQVASMLNRVMFPFYSSIQNDLEKVKKHYLEVIKYYSLIIYPIMISLIIIGEPIVLIFFGNKWTGTIIPMKILALSVLIDSLTSGFGLLFRSIGQSKMEMKIQVYTAIFVYIPLVIAGAYWKGATGVAIGILSSTCVTFIVAQILLKKNFNISVWELFKSIKITLFVSIITSIIISFLYYKTTIHYIGLFIFLFFIFYGIVIYLMRFQVVKLIQKVLKR